MEKFFREKFATCFNSLNKNNNAKENYKLIETQRKIYYFSKFSLDMEEFIKIYYMVKTIKTNVSKNMLEEIKVCINGI